MKVSGKTKTKTKITKSKTKRLSFRKMVRQEISREIQNKCQEIFYNNYGLFNYIDNNAFKSLMITPSQGAGEGDRIGNVIKLKKATLRIAIQLDSTNSTASQPKYVDFYIVKNKQSNLSVADAGRFLQFGNSSQGYDGQILDGLRDVNPSAFILKKRKRFTMANTFTSLNPIGYSKYPSTITFKMDLTKYYKKKLIYNDTVTSVYNDNLFLAIGCTDVNANNVAPLFEQKGDISFVVTWEYENA